jgi:hypothetical protein
LLRIIHMAKSRLTILVIVELTAAILASLLAGWAVTVAHVDPKVGFGVAFVASLHALVGLVTALVLTATLGLGVFAAIAGRLPHALGGCALPRRYVVPVLVGLTGCVVTVALMLA